MYQKIVHFCLQRYTKLWMANCMVWIERI